MEGRYRDEDSNGGCVILDHGPHADGPSELLPSQDASTADLSHGKVWTYLPVEGQSRSK